MNNVIVKIYAVFKTFKNPILFFFDYLKFLPHKEICYTIRNSDIVMLARTGTTDGPEIATVFSGLEYDLGVIPGQEGMIIIDLGGHIGSFSVYSADYFKQYNPKIIVVEPSVQNFQCLLKNLSLGNIKSVTPINASIGSKSGRAILDTSVRYNDSYSIISSDVLSTKTEECEAFTLMDLASNNDITGIIDLIKMDIEGSEYDLLSDPRTQEYLVGHVRCIIMEIHDIDANRNRNIIKASLRENFRIVEKGNIIYAFNLSSVPGRTMGGKYSPPKTQKT